MISLGYYQGAILHRCWEDSKLAEQTHPSATIYHTSLESLGPTAPTTMTSEKMQSVPVTTLIFDVDDTLYDVR